MTLLLLGLLLFLGTHSVSILAPDWRRGWIARHGEKPWKGLYSLVSLVGFALLIVGYGWARQSPVVLYTPPTWTRHLALLLMLPVFPLLLAAYLPGRIKNTLKHPMLVGVKVWAAAHLLANGDLGSIIFFGSFLVWAVLSRISVKRRDEVRPHGGPAQPPKGLRNDALAIVIGTVVYIAFAVWLHPWLIGVPVLPGRS